MVYKNKSLLETASEKEARLAVVTASAEEQQMSALFARLTHDEKLALVIMCESMTEEHFMHFLSKCCTKWRVENPPAERL